jgi:hypothetical protein
MNKLILSFENLINSNKQEFYKKRKLVIRHMTVERYTKELNLYLKIFNGECRLESVKYFMNKLDAIIDLIPSKFEVVRNIISDLYNKNIDKLTSPVKLLQYDRTSMADVKRIRELELTKFKENVKLDGIKNLELIVQ